MKRRKREKKYLRHGESRDSGKNWSWTSL